MVQQMMHTYTEEKFLKRVQVASNRTPMFPFFLVFSSFCRHDKSSKYGRSSMFGSLFVA